MRMEYYKKLQQKKVFHKADIDAMTKNTNTSKSLLKNAMKKKLITRIKHDYYATTYPGTHYALADRFMVGSNATKSSYISHHTAFEYRGIMNQVYRIMFVSSLKPFTDFDFENGTYKYVPTKYHFGLIKKNNVIVTDMERTILDSIKDIDKYTDVDELLQCLDLVEEIDEDKLTEYLAIYDNKFLYQKAGYILSNFKEFNLSQKFFETCKSHIGKSIRYFEHGLEHYPDGRIYDSYWQLFVPPLLRNEYEWLGIIQ